MRQIKIHNRELYADVDDEDYDRLLNYSWYLHSFGYPCAKVNGKTILMHRIILNVIDKSLDVDHINQRPLDNRKNNLRVCSHAENLRNQKKQKDTSSKYKGVSWHKRVNKWRASIMHNKNMIHLGYFKDELEAAVAYDDAAILYFGEFARLNFQLYGA